MMKGVMESLFAYRRDAYGDDQNEKDDQDDESLEPFEKILRDGRAQMEKTVRQAQADFENSQSQKNKKPSAAERKAE